MPKAKFSKMLLLKPQDQYVSQDATIDHFNEYGCILTTTDMRDAKHFETDAEIENYLKQFELSSGWQFEIISGVYFEN